MASPMTNQTIRELIQDQELQSIFNYIARRGRVGRDDIQRQFKQSGDAIEKLKQIDLIEESPGLSRFGGHFIITTKGMQVARKLGPA